MSCGIKWVLEEAVTSALGAVCRPNELRREDKDHIVAHTR
jgi:hypothetical protein